MQVEVKKLSKYTTEVRFICEQYANLSESQGYSNVEEIIQKALPKIFDFSFPIFDENYRNVLCTKIIKHYYTREIGCETVGLWKLWLNVKMNEVMPYYNQLYKSELLEFNPLYTKNVTNSHKNEYGSNAEENESINDTTTETRKTEVNGNTSSTNTTETTGSGTSDSSVTEWDLFNDTPQGSVVNISDNTYLTNATKNTNETTGNSSTKNNSSGSGSVTNAETNNTSGNTTYGHIRGNSNQLKSTEEYTEEVLGYDGISASDLLSKFRETFLNIDMLIIEECSDLFFQLW